MHGIDQYRFAPRSDNLIFLSKIRTVLDNIILFDLQRNYYKRFQCFLVMFDLFAVTTEKR